MATKLYAKRYSQAIFKIALETRELERWQSDLGKITSLKDDAAFYAALQSPKLHFNIKAKLLAERLADIKPSALNLVYLLITRGKLGMIRDIAGEYQRLLDSHRGIEHAEVITAVRLDDEDKTGLGDRLGAIINKKIAIELQVDSSVIGGMVVRVGGKLIDGSTRRILLALKKELADSGI